MNPSEISTVDLAIIGGGINGAGLAAQAAQAGLSVALFEKGDFASGTSSKSTKLIHGGIRYLEQARFSLVFEALHERYRLIQMAPHLVHPISFLLPVYKGDKRPAWMLKIGLWLYDLLAGRKNIARHRWFSPAQALAEAPDLNMENLLGCGLYYDAQVNDARLVMENILAAEKAGARCLNYCRVTQIDLQPSQARVFFHDERSGQQGTLSASCLVNASGPWANLTSELVSENAPLARGPQAEGQALGVPGPGAKLQTGPGAKLVSQDSQKLVRPTRGTHIVVPEVLSQQAVLVMSREDSRVLFVIPWRGESLVGTTDLDDPGDPDKVEPTEEEIAYLLKEASRVFPKASWDRSRVLAAFSGLRPLAWSDGGHASSVSREDKILSNGNLFTIVGGKLTTYHSMAQKTLDHILKYLRKAPTIKGSEHLPGTPTKPWDLFLKEETPQWVSAYGITQAQADHLARLYGQKAGDVLRNTLEEPRLLEKLHSARPEILAQVAYAVQAEKAFHLADVLLRRLEIGYSRERWGEAPEKASRLMAELLNWDENRRQKELADYRQALFPAP